MDLVLTYLKLSVQRIISTWGIFTWYSLWSISNYTVVIGHHADINHFSGDFNTMSRGPQRLCGVLLFINPYQTVNLAIQQLRTKNISKRYLSLLSQILWALFGVVTKLNAFKIISTKRYDFALFILLRWNRILNYYRKATEFWCLCSSLSLIKHLPKPVEDALGVWSWILKFKYTNAGI